LTLADAPMRSLPDPLPDDPVPLVQEWLEDAEHTADQHNPSAMALATSDGRGRPSVRMVLLKRVSTERGYGVFYTHRKSRKGRELAANPWAAGALYWERLGRQLRLEGRILVSPDDESDAYFATRPLGSQINAWISAQSQPIAAYAELQARVEQKKGALAKTQRVPRPPFWGGYRLWFDAIEFWIEGPDRLHERARYERDLPSTGSDEAGLGAGPWRHALLQP
jgi:pyridoxamine 5'-phosphate oxidase